MGGVLAVLRRCCSSSEVGLLCFVAMVAIPSLSFFEGFLLHFCDKCPYKTIFECQEIT